MFDINIVSNNPSQDHLADNLFDPPIGPNDPPECSAGQRAGFRRLDSLNYRNNLVKSSSWGSECDADGL